MSTMALPRASLSSTHSKSSNAVDPQSAFSSPKLTQGQVEQPLSGDPPIPETRSATVSSSSSIEPKEYVPQDRYGWPLLADIMAEVPDFAAFPRYRGMNMRNLLYYKAQIDNLQLRILREEEEVSLQLERYDEIADEKNSAYHTMLMDMRQLLNCYSTSAAETQQTELLTSVTDEALLQHSKVSALSDPEAHNMRSLCEWLVNEEVTVRGCKGNDKTWGVHEPGTSNRDKAWTVLKALLLAKQPPKADLDLVAPYHGTKIDGLTNWLVYWLMPFYWEVRDRRRSAEMPSVPAWKEDTEAQNDVPKKVQNKPRRDPKTLESVSEMTALRLTSGLSTVIACLIPVVAIAALTQLHGQRDLLICITGFAVLFAVVLIFFTQGTSSRTEIFAATATFSAVMVVFISQPTIQVSPGISVSV